MRWDRDNLQKILERKVDSAIQGERLSKKLYQAEAEIEAKNWEKRNRDHSFHASRLADQAQREKISLYGELELRNRLFQEKCKGLPRN